VKNDDEKLLVAKLLIPAAILFTYYGMGYSFIIISLLFLTFRLLYLPLKWLRYVVLVQVIPCAIILGVDLGVREYLFYYH